MVAQCCSCRKVRIGERWTPVDEPLDEVISHTYCPTCYLRAVCELHESVRKMNPPDEQSNCL